MTTSTLTFVPSRQDNGRSLTCRASNHLVQKGQHESTVKLNIFCKYHNLGIPVRCYLILCLVWSHRRYFLSSPFFFLILLYWNFGKLLRRYRLRRPNQISVNTNIKSSHEPPRIISSKSSDWNLLCVGVPDVPILHLSLGSSLNPDDIEEGDDVYFECKVNANPSAYKVLWKHNVSYYHLFAFSLS